MYGLVWARRSKMMKKEYIIKSKSKLFVNFSQVPEGVVIVILLLTSPVWLIFWLENRILTGSIEEKSKLNEEVKHDNPNTI